MRYTFTMRYREAGAQKIPTNVRQLVGSYNSCRPTTSDAGGDSGDAAPPDSGLDAGLDVGPYSTPDTAVADAPSGPDVALADTTGTQVPYPGSITGCWTGKCGVTPANGTFTANVDAKGSVTGSFAGGDRDAHRAGGHERQADGTKCRRRWSVRLGWHADQERRDDQRERHLRVQQRLQGQVELDLRSLSRRIQDRSARIWLRRVLRGTWIRAFGWP